MKLLFVADGRSPTALNWIQYFIKQGHAVHLASTFACQPPPGLASFHVTPAAFSSVKSAPSSGGGVKQARKKGLWGAGLVGLRTGARQWLGPFTLPLASPRLRRVIQQVQPDIVHAMRIPFEGMLAALARPERLVLSVWGNDFTLHAVSNPFMDALTRLALRRAAGLHTDCNRDRTLAYGWGYPEDRPAVVLPGGGGIQLDIFYPPTVPANEPVVVNPRGFRAYVRNDTFFSAIPLVLKGMPAARFACPAMAGEQQVEGWIEQMRLGQAVKLLPRLPRSEMAGVFRSAQVVVSPTTHDGTPNTLLEAMACGCFPVVGDIESLREWITDGKNGFLVDPADPQALANAILKALRQPSLRQSAAIYNRQEIATRAEYNEVMRKAEEFYQLVLNE